LYLKGDGKGNFISLSILQSGIYLPGNMKALVKLRGNDEKYLIAASENKGPLKILQLSRTIQMIPVRASDVTALIKFRSGKIRKTEINYGSSFLSQSARFLIIDNNTTGIEITDSQGKVRSVSF